MNEGRKGYNMAFARDDRFLEIFIFCLASTLWLIQYRMVFPSVSMKLKPAPFLYNPSRSAITMIALPSVFFFGSARLPLLLSDKNTICACLNCPSVSTWVTLML